MIERDAYQDLADWKRNHRGKALLVDGARQIGKTYLIERFAEREYRDFVKVDFLKDDAASALLSQATDVRSVVEALGLISGKPLDWTGEHRDVADPWYTGDFDATYRDVLAGCKALLAALP